MPEIAQVVDFSFSTSGRRRLQRKRLMEETISMSRRKGPDISISSMTVASTAMAIMKEMTMQMHCIVMTAVDLAEFEDSVVIVAVGAIVVVVEVEDTIAEED